MAKNTLGGARVDRDCMACASDLVQLKYFIWAEKNYYNRSDAFLYLGVYWVDFRYLGSISV